MITIVFSQTTEFDIPVVESIMPIEKQCAQFEKLLLSSDNQTIHTYSEFVLLIASWLVRNKKLDFHKIEFIQMPQCQYIRMDGTGEFTRRIDGGLFSQRMKYLFD